MKKYSHTSTAGDRSIVRIAYHTLTNVVTNILSQGLNVESIDWQLPRVFKASRYIPVNTYLPFSPFWSWFQNKFWWSDVYLLEL